MARDDLHELQDKLLGAIEEGGSGLEFNPAGRSSARPRKTTEKISEGDAPETPTEPVPDILDPEDVVPLLSFVDEYVSVKFDVSTADEEQIDKIANALVLVLEKYGLAYVAEFSPEISLGIGVALVALAKWTEYRVAHADDLQVEIRPKVVEDETGSK